VHVSGRWPGMMEASGLHPGKVKAPPTSAQGLVNARR
jgi:hypothetical protein